MRGAAAAVAAAALLATAARANLVEQISFAPPFQEFESDGSRKISDHFRVHGHASVNENFVRLTTDRQSKKGALWSRTSVGRTSFSTMLRFRISGSGKKFFGDGIALWITQQSRYITGDLHANNPRFVGIGVIVDTFENTENLDKHKDVGLVINDGTRNVEEMLDGIVGCDADVRFWEKRQDFDVHSGALVKVEITGRDVKVLVDEREDGRWQECASVTLPESIPEDWLLMSHVGVTASTGQLADNHDVLELQSYSDMAAARLAEEASRDKQHFEINEDTPLDERLIKIEGALNSLLARLEKYEHEVEHQLVGVDDHIHNMLSKIENREDNAEIRIEDIENRLSMVLQEDTDKRISRLETQMGATVKRMLKEKHAEYESRFESMQDLADDWFYPLLFMVLLFMGGGFGMYRYHIFLKKTHLL